MMTRWHDDSFLQNDGTLTVSRKSADLQPDEVHVWYIPLSAGTSLPSAWISALSPQERLIAAGFPSERSIQRASVCEMSREHYLAFCWARRRLLADSLGIAPNEVCFITTPGGKPMVQQGCSTASLQFSSSHSWGHALIAVSRTLRVGVDLQRIDPDAPMTSIAQARFSPRSSAALLHAGSATARCRVFFRLWSLHEAYFKYCGGTENWNEVTIIVPPLPRGEVFFKAPASREGQLRCALYELEPPVPGYTAALAVSSIPGEWRTTLRTFIPSATCALPEQGERT